MSSNWSLKISFKKEEQKLLSISAYIQVSGLHTKQIKAHSLRPLSLQAGKQTRFSHWKGVYIFKEETHWKRDRYTKKNIEEATSVEQKKFFAKYLFLLKFKNTRGVAQN